MLALPHTNSWGFVYTNQDNGSNTPGTSVTPGATNAEGSWTQIASAANIEAEVQYASLFINSGGTSGSAKQQLLDFGIDPAGGSSYTAWFSNLACGASGSGLGGAFGKPFHFPCKIPSGASVAVRIQGASGTAGTVNVLAQFWGKPSRPELWRPAAYTETLGTITNSSGPSFTPGNASWGSWASLGTTAKKHFWAQLGVQINNGTHNNESTHIQLAIGDGTNQHIITDFHLGSLTSESENTTPQTPCAWEIPAGAELWVRGNCSGAPASGYNATAVLFGG